MAQMFRKIILDFRYANTIFRKYSVNSGFADVSYKNINTNLFFENKVLVSYFLSKRNLSTARETPHQRSHTCLLNGPLCSQTSVTINSVNRYCPTLTETKHYSNSTNLAVNHVVMYNNGIFRSIAESLPVECAMDALRTIHTSTGLPWWASIITTTVLSRTLITLPFTIHQHQIVAKLENLKHEMKGITERIKMEMRMAMLNSKWDRNFATSYYNDSVNKEWKELIMRENCHPFKIVAMIILQMPLWISFSFALRNFCLKFPNLDDLAERDYVEFVNGGFGWMKDLTDVDHTFILPIAFGITNLAVLELHRFLDRRERTKFVKIFTHFQRGFIIFLMGVMAYIPSCLTLFWTTNAIVTLLQNIVLMSPQFRRLGRIPKTDSELQQPYSELCKRAKRKFRLPIKQH